MLGDDSLPAPGQIIGGRYRLLRVLARSQRAIVLEAERPNSTERVALKVFHAQRTRAPGGLSKLLSEAQALARLDHPNVARVLDFGEHQGTLFIVMPLLPGVTLRAWLAGRALDVSTAIQVLSPIAQGLAAAHAVGILHHALNPEHVMVAPASGAITTVSLIGFAGAKTLSSGRQTMGVDQLASMAAAYPYVAPELLLGETALPDARGDVYSLGALAFTALTGKLPHDAQNPVDLALLLMSSPPPLITTHVPGLPSALAETVARALRRKASDRFASVQELHEALLATAWPGHVNALPWASEAESARSFSVTEALNVAAYRGTLPKSSDSSSSHDSGYERAVLPKNSLMPLALSALVFALMAGAFWLSAAHGSTLRQWLGSEPAVVAAPVSATPDVLEPAHSAVAAPQAALPLREPSSAPKPARVSSDNDWEAASPSPDVDDPRPLAAPVVAAEAPVHVHHRAGRAHGERSVHHATARRVGQVVPSPSGRAAELNARSSEVSHAASPSAKQAASEPSSLPLSKRLGMSADDF
ncbi:MAG: serine/threonine protein kinase [Myxococcaceae bacterium]|nr:serine/threonine protein kinase [Myxococcaceae bacterium]